MSGQLPMAQAETLPPDDQATAPKAPAPLPTEDEFFGPKTLPTEDEFFAPRPKQVPWIAKAIMPGLALPAEGVAAGGSQILSAFGHGLSEGWNGGTIGFAPEVERVLSKAGVLGDLKTGQQTIYQAFNGAILRPAATAIDWTLSGMNALFAGSQAAASEAGKELEAAGFTGLTIGGYRILEGGNLLGRDIAAMPEAFMGSPHIGPFRPLPEPVARVLPEASAPRFEAALSRWEEARAAREELRVAGENARDMSLEIYEAYANRVIGAGGERAYFGLDDAYVPDPVLGDRLVPPEQMIPQQQPPADIHAAARRIAPDVFNEYDALAGRRDLLREQIAQATTTLQENARAQAPGAAEIADLERRMEDTTPRLRKKYEARLEELRPAYEEFMANGDQMALLTRETPEISAMRQEMMEADYRMRDLSPDVTRAYREASAAFPEVVEEAPSVEVPERMSAVEAERPREAMPVQPVEAATEPQQVPVRAPEVSRETPARPVDIAQDVATRLEAAGRPADEAAASAAIIDAYWKTRAARLGEDAGDLYRRFGPDIRAGGEGGRAGLGQGKIRLPAAQREFAQSGEAFNWSPGYHNTLLRDTGIDYTVRDNHVVVNMVRTLEESRRQGQAREAMLRLIEEADARGMTIALTPEPMEAGTSVTGLRRFYRSLGFEPNTGRRADHSISESMVRRPTLRQDTRGAAALRNGRAIITLFDKADASTFMHETGHEWLERMIADGANTDAPQGMRADADTVRKWLGMEADQAVPTTRQHEKFARGFEQYLREGIAPSRALDGVFAQFRDWLTRIYETIKRLGKPINEDIRNVFDRLITEKPERAVIAPERELVTNRPENPAYVAVPKPPESLLSFLKRKGGLKDTGGDVASIVGGAKGRPGLINKQDAVVRDGKVIYRGGMELDEAARQAWEEGYFPEHADVPDHQALLAKIEEEARGNPQYSEHDEAAVEAHRYALDHNAEVDRLAQEHGIDPTGLTREQFFDRVTEKVSEAELEGEISNAVSHVDEFADEARHWLEEYAGERPAPSLEDLESEWRAAEASGSVASGARGNEPPGSAGRLVSPGAGREGPSGGSAPDRGGAGPSPRIDRTEPPSNPNGQFDTPASPLVDKAGNIRIDNLNIPEDVARAIREAAEQNEDFIGARRGVVSDSQVMDLADALGMTPQDLAKRKIGEAYNAEQVMAARKLLIRSATEVRDLMRKAAEGGEADILAYAEAKARHRMIQDQVAGITAEAGRALRAFRFIGDERGLVEGVDNFLRDATGRTLFQMQEEARKGAALETPAQVSKFILDSEKPTFWQMITEFWINSLLSGPQTHVANITGNTITTTTSIAETGLAGIAGEIRRAVGGKGGVELGETKAELFGLIQGVQDGLKVGWKAFKEEEFKIGNKAAQAEMFQVDPRQFRSIPSVEVAGHEIGGKQLRIPTRALTAEDAVFRSIAYRKSINGQAYRMAVQEGLDGMELNARVAQLVTDPSEAMMAEAVKASSYATFTNDLGKVGRAMQQLSNSHMIVKFLIPFLRTPINIAKYAVERTPASLLWGETRANLTGRNGPAAMDMQIGRLALGTAVMVGIMALARQELITGSGPSDPHEMAMWRLSGKQPYSVRVGDTWYAVRRFDPLGFLFSLVADTHQALSQVGDQPAEKVGVMLANSIGKSFLEGTGMRGLSDAVKAITDPERYGGHWSKSFLASFYPFGGLVGQSARAMDPYMRDTRTFVDELKARTPFLSQSLPPRYDIFGQPIPGREALGPDALSVLYTKEVNDDPVIKAMTRLHVFPGAVSKKINGVELTADEYAEYAGSAGRLMKMQLDALVHTRGFTDLPDGIQLQTINGIVHSSRQSAASMMMMSHPHIISDALAAKRLQLIEGKKGTATVH